MKVISGKITMEWYDIEVMALRGPLIEKILQVIYEQIRSTAAATGEDYITDARWDLIYDPEVMKLTLERVLPK